MIYLTIRLQAYKSVTTANESAHLSGESSSSQVHPLSPSYLQASEQKQPLLLAAKPLPPPPVIPQSQIRTRTAPPL